MTDITTRVQRGPLRVRISSDTNGAGKTTLAAVIATALEAAGHTVVHDTTATYPEGVYDDMMTTLKTNLAAGVTNPVRPMHVQIIEVEPPVRPHD